MIHERVPEHETHEALAWLFEQRSKFEVGTGFDPDGWEDSIWVLHSMYEHEDTAISLTYDEAGRLLRAGKPANPHPIKARMNELLSTGVGLGMASNPGPGWHRVLWTEFAERHGIPLPVYRGVPIAPSPRSGSWPVSIQPPCEGSMDEDTLRELLAALARAESAGGATRCWSFFASIPARDWECPTLFHTRLDQIPELPRAASQDFAPHNVWPDDRSWFVYTDYDLSATRVSGSARLIGALEENAELETFRLDRADRPV